MNTASAWLPGETTAGETVAGETAAGEPAVVWDNTTTLAAARSAQHQHPLRTICHMSIHSSGWLRCYRASFSDGSAASCTAALTACLVAAFTVSFTASFTACFTSLSPSCPLVFFRSALATFLTTGATSKFL